MNDEASVVTVLDFPFSVGFGSVLGEKPRFRFGFRHAGRPVQATKAVIHAANVSLTLPLAGTMRDGPLISNYCPVVCPVVPASFSMTEMFQLW